MMAAAWDSWTMPTKRESLLGRIFELTSNASGRPLSARILGMKTPWLECDPEQPSGEVHYEHFGDVSHWKKGVHHEETGGPWESVHDTETPYETFVDAALMSLRHTFVCLAKPKSGKERKEIFEYARTHRLIAPECHVRNPALDAVLSKHAAKVKKGGFLDYCAALVEMDAVLRYSDDLVRAIEAQDPQTRARGETLIVAWLAERLRRERAVVERQVANAKSALLRELFARAGGAAAEAVAEHAIGTPARQASTPPVEAPALTGVEKTLAEIHEKFRLALRYEDTAEYGFHWNPPDVGGWSGAGKSGRKAAKAKLKEVRMQLKALVSSLSPEDRRRIPHRNLVMSEVRRVDPAATLPSAREEAAALLEAGRRELAAQRPLEALRSAQSAIALLELADSTSEEMAQSLELAAYAEGALGHAAAGVALLDRRLDVQSRMGAPTLAIAATEMLLGGAHLAKGGSGEAVRHLARSLELFSAELGATDPRLAPVIEELIKAQVAAGLPDAAADSRKRLASLEVAPAPP